MGIFSKRREMTPAEEAARRRQSHIPADEPRAPHEDRSERAASRTASPAFETKELRFSQLGFARARTDVDAKLAPYIADGWEIVSDDRKRYGTGGKHTVLLRRALA